MTVSAVLGGSLRWVAGLPWPAIWGVVNAARSRPLLLLAFLVVARILVDGANPLGVVLSSLLGSAVVVFYLRRKLTRRAEWVYAGACLGAVTLGLTLVALIGTGDRVLNVASILGWAGAALAWWLHHEVRGCGYSGPQVINLWNEHIRDGKGVMAGAEISGPAPFEHGETYKIELVPYKQTLGKAQADLPNWTTALDVPMENLILEKDPDRPKSPRWLRLQHITRSPIEDTVYFDRPRYEDGRILLGPYADGIGEAWLRLYTENSMWSTSLTGGTGIGKTRLTETIVITGLAMRDVGQHTVIFYMDGQNGASSPALFRRATWPVGVNGALRMLAALERIADWRQKENRAHLWTGFTPSAERPGILVLVDEAHLIIPLAAERFANLAKSVRKLGIGFFVAAHDSSLKTFIDDSLRAALLGGNGLVMNVSSRIVGNLIPGLDINPADLPRIAGYGVVVGAPGSDIRTAPFRGRYAPDVEETARAEAGGTTVPVPTIEEWFERYPALELDRGAARAAGKDYATRHETATAEREALLRLIHAEDDGDDEVDDGPLGGLVGVGVVDADDDTAGTLRAATRADGEQQGTCAEQIKLLDWAGYGEMATAQVLAELPSGTTLSTAREALARLGEAGVLVKGERGRTVTYRMDVERRTHT